jgi:hypothetical protein
MSNFDAVMNALDRLVDVDFNDTKSYVGKKLATDVLDSMAAGMQKRLIDRQVDPDDSPLPDNAPSYRAQPKKGNKIIGFLTGEMLSDQQFKGSRAFEKTSAIQTFGNNDFCRRKGQWFTRGSKPNPPYDLEHSGAKNQPPRPFYDLDDEIRDNGIQIVNEAFDRMIASFNGSPF